MTVLKKKPISLSSKLTLDEVKHVAKLSSLPLTGEEEKKFQEQLSETVNYINELNEVNTKKVSPTAQVTGKTNEFREDIVAPSFSQEDALKNAVKSYNGYFVSKIQWSIEPPANL